MNNENLTSDKKAMEIENKIEEIFIELKSIKYQVNRIFFVFIIYLIYFEVIVFQEKNLLPNYSK